MKNNILYLIGLMLYAGEGAKTGSTVDFINSNPVYITAFVEFLRRCCKIDENRLRFYLYCFDDQEVSQLMEFWCQQLNVRLEQFTKPYIRKSKSSLKRRNSSYGVLHVRYSDKLLLYAILTAIDNTLEEFRVGTQAVNGG